MWSVRWVGCVVALVVGLVLGEPRLSFHPPVYLYEFGDLSEQPVDFATVGHIKPGQRFTQVDLKPFPCARGERFVRVVVLNAHNAAHVSVHQRAAYIQYAPGEHAQSTYIMWASSAGPQDPACLHHLNTHNMQSDNRRRILQYHLQRAMPLHARQGYPLKNHYASPGHVTSPHHGQRQQWSAHNDDVGNNVIEGRTGNPSAKKTAHKTKKKDSIPKDSSESSDDVADKLNNDVANKPYNDGLNEKRGEDKNEAPLEPVWKLKRQRKKHSNKTMETHTFNDAQDIEDPFNITETVKFGINTKIFRRTPPRRVVKEEVIEEYITPEQFVPSGMAVIPGFTYQFFKPSSSEAMAMNLPPPANLPKDQTEWDAYFKSLNDHNSSMIVPEMPETAAVPNVPF